MLRVRDERRSRVQFDIVEVGFSPSQRSTYPTLTVLPPTAWQLDTAATKIQQKLHDPILYHQAWRIERDHLLAGKLTFQINRETEDDLDSQPMATQLNGWIELSLTRYFDIKLNLSLAEPASQVGRYLKNKHSRCEHQAWCYFHFSSKRRTRSGVINYLDNPLYGALLLITPIQSLSIEKPPAIEAPKGLQL